MCRFVAYLGQEITLSSLVTEPDHSLIHQSYDSNERSEPLNGDGSGVTLSYVASKKGGRRRDDRIGTTQRPRSVDAGCTQSFAAGGHEP